MANVVPKGKWRSYADSWEIESGVLHEHRRAQVQMTRMLRNIGISMLIPHA
jgi:hypothetical protein